MASPGAKQTWPTVAACWSPSAPPIGDLAVPRAPGRGMPVEARVARRPDLGEHRTGDAEEPEQLVVPLERLEIHQHGAARVGDVGDVLPAVRAAGEVPDDPGVDGAEERVAAVGRLAQPVDVVEHPLELAAGEVRGRDQAGPLPDHVAAAVGVERLDDRVGPGVLPDDRVGVGAAGVPVPDDGGLALVGDADAVDVGGGQVQAGQAGPDDRLGPLPDLQRVVLDPAGPRQDLLVLELVAADLVAVVVEHHEPGTRRALVDRTDEVSHVVRLSHPGASLASGWVVLCPTPFRPGAPGRPAEAGSRAPHCDGAPSRSCARPSRRPTRSPSGPSRTAWTSRSGGPPSSWRYAAGSPSWRPARPRRTSSPACCGSPLPTGCGRCTST